VTGQTLKALPKGDHMGVLNRATAQGSREGFGGGGKSSCGLQYVPSTSAGLTRLMMERTGNRYLSILNSALVSIWGVGAPPLDADWMGLFYDDVLRGVKRR